MKFYKDCTLIGLALYFLSLSANAQFSTPRTLSGSLVLESGVATEDLQIVITVTEYNVFRVPQDSWLSTVRIKEGQSSVNYAVRGIDGSSFPFEFSIRIICSQCPNVVDQQYYSPVRQLFSLENSAYIDRDEFPSRLNYVLEKGTFIEGALALNGNVGVEKDLIFELNAFISSAPGNSVVTRQVILPKGQQTVDYRLDGIIPEVGHSSLVTYSCMNCDSGRRISGEVSGRLTTQLDHNNIDFKVSLNGSLSIVPVIQLLLE